MKKIEKEKNKGRKKMKKSIQLFMLAILFAGIFAFNFTNAQTKRQDINDPIAIKLESGDVLMKMNDNSGVHTNLKTSYTPSQGFSPRAANDIYLQSGFEEAWTFGAPPGWTFFPAANGLNSWHRTDFNTGWTSNSGATNPVSYMGGVAARFSSFNAPNGSIGQMNTPDIDLSGSTDSVFVSFWFTNSTGADSLKLFVSTDGGATYPINLGFVTLTGGPWVRVFAYVPSTSATTRIRFEARSDFGTTDIGVDEVVVYQKGSGYSGTISIPGTWGSFAEAARRLTIFGVTGPLTINVSPGTYTDSVTFSPIPGASLTNTITFNNSGGTVSVVRRGALVSNTTIGTTIARTDDAVISLWGVDFITFDSINVSNDGAFTGTEWGYHVRALFPTDGANNNTIQNCLIAMSKTNLISRGIRHFPFWVLTSSGGPSSNNHYYNNDIRSCGFQGILLQGQGGGGGFASFFDINNEIASVSGGTARFFDIGGGSGSANGVALTGQNGTKIYGCLFDSIWVTSGAANALLFGTTTTAGDSTINVEAYKNQFTRIVQTAGSTTTILTAIRIPGNTNNTRAKIYNNFISNLRSNGTSANAIDAIYNQGNSNVGTKVEWYYNTVLLDNQAIGGSGGNVVMRIDASTTVNNLIIKNNVFVNKSAQKGASINYIYNRTGGVFTATNNGLYIDTTIANRNIGFYTSVRKTLPAWQTGSGTEISSFYENAPFINSATLPYDLHLDIVLTQYESGATPISGITTDIDNQTRPGPPDVGADEFDGFPLDLLGPIISYTPLSNTTSVSNRSFAGVTITDPNGVDVTPGTKPRVYYKRKTDANTFNNNTSGTAGWKFDEANGVTSPFDFTIDYSLLSGGSGVTVGDSVQYFVVAQDLAPTPNVGINSGIFAAQPSSVALTAAAFPIGGFINSYIIVGTPLSGDYTVGVLLFNRVTGKNITFDRIVNTVTKEVAETIYNDNKDSKEPEEIRMVMKEVEEVSWIPMENGKVYKEPLYVKRADNPNLPIDAGGGVYATITAAIGDLTLRGASGAVRFLLKDGTYPSETLPIGISPWTGASSTNTLTIKLDTAASSITGTSSSGVFVVSGADYFTIDGSQSNTANTVCPVSTATRGLTITNTSTSTSSAVIWLQTIAGDSATHNTIKNCNLVGNSNTTTLFGVGSGSSTISTSSLGTNNNSNSYVNNNISKTQYGIYSQGASAGNKNTGTVINQNLINTVSPNNVSRGGIWTGFENNITVSGNNISGITQASSPDVFGITLGVGISMSASTIGTNEVTDATVTKNVIGTVTNTGTFSAAGISVAAAASGTNLIANNMVSGVNANATAGDFAAGILVGGGLGSTTNVYYNSVTMIGTFTGGTYPSFALAVLSSNPNPVVDLQNNIFTSTGSTGANLNRSIGLNYSTFTNLTSNTNDLFVSGTGSAIGQTVNLTNSGATSHTTLLDWQTNTGNDAASKNVEPVFVSSTNLHLDSTNASNIENLNAMGTAVSVTDDIDCQVRGFSTSLIGPPGIGADELNAVTGKHYVNDNSQVGDVFTDTVGNDANPGTPSDPFLTITYAISQSNPGDTIYVDAGTYTEQVEMNKDLVVIGAGAALTKVVSPAILSLFFTSSRPTTINNYPVIYAHDAAKIVIKSLTVDGAGQGNANNRFVGIGYHRAGGYMEDLEVKAVREAVLGVHEALGIFAYANAPGTARTVYVIDNNVYDFEKSGITMSGSVLTAYVDSNTVTGQGPNAFVSQIGVELGFGAKGSVTNNTIAGISHNPFIPTTVASDILVIKPGDTTTTSGNTISDAQAGIAYYYASGRISNNTVKFTAANMSTTYWVGIVVENGTATVSQNTVNGGGKGVGIGAVAISGEVDEITTMNDINNFVDSTEAGFVIFTSDSGIANCTINENSITNSVTYAIFKFGTDTDTVDATCNWYGTTNDSVIASKINGPVDYIPFLTNGTDDQLGTPGFQPVLGSCNGPLITGKLDLTICLEACSPNEDTISVCMRSTTSPYPVISCATGVIDTSGYVSLSFSNVSNGPSYYIVVNHRNSIETWSATGQTFTAGFMTYDFTTDTSKAFGGNMTFVGGAACIYTGDVDQDGVVDGTDAALVETAAENFTTGYVVTDLNCDEFVDGTDGAYVDNNAFNFVMVEKPTVFSNDTKRVNVEKVSEDIKGKVQNSFAKMRIMPLK